MEIDWNNILSTTDNMEVVALREHPLGEEVQVTFDRVFTASNGSVGAVVTTCLIAAALGFSATGQSW